jgi:hypothetical protein
MAINIEKMLREGKKGKSEPNLFFVKCKKLAIARDIRKDVRDVPIDNIDLQMIV